MPNVVIDMWEGRDSDTKRKLIQEISKVIVDVLKVDVHHVRVILNDIPKDNWGIDGEQASRIQR